MDNKQKQIAELGDKVKDPVSGITGIITAQSTFLHGCKRMGVQTKDIKDGKLSSPTYFDQPQLVVIKKRVVSVEEGDRQKSPGGPMDSYPTRNEGPSR